MRDAKRLRGGTALVLFLLYAYDGRTGFMPREIIRRKRFASRKRMCFITRKQLRFIQRKRYPLSRNKAFCFS
jgi:hypothetical protein